MNIKMLCVNPGLGIIHGAHSFTILRASLWSLLLGVVVIIYNKNVSAGFPFGMEITKDKGSATCLIILRFPSHSFVWIFVPACKRLHEFHVFTSIF